MNNNLLYTVEDKPPFGLSLLLAAQHLLAALGGIIAVPLVIGNVLKLPTEDTISECCTFNFWCSDCYPM